MRRSKSRSSSLDLLATNSFDFSSHRSSVYTDRHVPIPLLSMEPGTICVRNFAGIAMRPFVSIVCSYSPRNIVTARYSSQFVFLWSLAGMHAHWSPALCLPFLAFSLPTVQPRKFPTFPHSSPPHYTIFCKPCARNLSTNFYESTG